MADTQDGFVPIVVGDYKIVLDGAGKYRVTETSGPYRMLAKRFTTPAAAVKRAEQMTAQNAAREG